MGDTESGYPPIQVVTNLYVFKSAGITRGLRTRLPRMSVRGAGIAAERAAQIGIDDGLVRLSVGIEDVRDLIGDLEQALGHR
jgi:O-succinylhomoserine sulfhydrylase